VDGDLLIRTRRHCVPGGDGARIRDTTPTHPEPCGSPGNTVYSSGRIQLPDAITTGGDFAVAFRARVPGNARRGTRVALWLVNEYRYCSGAMPSTDLGELDVLEWYSRRPRTSTATTHVTCTWDDGAAHYLSDGARTRFDPTKFHTWSVRRRGDAVTYRIDDRLVARHTCGSGALDRTGGLPCDRILDAPWQVIVQGEVFSRPPGHSWLAGPRDGRRFPTQTLVVRDLQLVF
jgi:hypothetical protein